MARLIVFTALLLGILASCAVPPRTGERSIRVSPVRREHWSAGALRVHVLSVNGARVPAPALQRSIATLTRQTGLPVEIHDDGDISIELDADGRLPDPFPWPVRVGDRTLTLDELGRTPGRQQLLDQPLGGVLGAVVKTNFAAEPVLRPLVEPGVILVAAVPGSIDGSGVTGYAAHIPNAPDAGMHVGLVVLRASAIARVSNWFISEEKLWEWTLTHEAGHVLGVPGDNSHVWIVPGLGAHCTHPECVMYTGVDWRVVLSGLLHGWPLDYCKECSKEIAAARPSGSE